MTEFLLILGVVLLYGALHSWLASLWMKRRARHMFGTHADRWFRLLYNSIAVLTFLPVLALPVVLPDHRLYRIPSPWSWLAAAGQVLAAVTLVVGLLHTDVWEFFGLRQALFGPPAKPPDLVVGGLYRWVRHPLYSAGLAFVWLMPVMTRNLLALCLGVTVYIFLGAWLEERKLLVDFGQAYENYRRKTGMIIPGVRWPY
jgi:protein-S-isoprenylcysteine O-methyltransferase Ste14